MATEEKVTYCRICEPLCGMVATVDDGELTKLRPDPDHPLSAGFACPKGIAMTEVQNDPDRVLHPLRRRAGRLASSGSPGPRRWTRSARGSARSASATAAARSAGTWATRAPSRTRTRSGSRAFSTRSARRTPTPPPRRTSPTASPPARFLYGSPFIVPIPDLARTDFLLVVGANPLVSHGSVLSAPRVKDQLHAITERGGRVVVVDPRRSETARAFEHVAIDPDGDAWLLLSMLEVIFAEGLEDRGAIERQSTGVDALRRLAAEHPAGGDRGPQRRRRPRGARASPATWRGAERAAVYGRTGSCLGRNGTLVAFLLDALNLVTGNLDREGGAMFGDPPIDFSRIADMAGLGTYAKVRSRVGDLPEVLGSLPGLGDGEGDDDARRGPDPGDVRLRRQPGALGAERRRARGGDRRARALGRDRPLRHRHRRATATSSCRRRRCTSARTSRCRSWPCSAPRSSR